MLKIHKKLRQIRGFGEVVGQVFGERGWEVVGFEDLADGVLGGGWGVVDHCFGLGEGCFVGFSVGRVFVSDIFLGGREDGDGGGAYSSLFAAKYPPKPIDIAPAVNSARPANITTRVFPKADKPAVRAKGTVNPSDNPIIASETTRASIFPLLPLLPPTPLAL